VSTPYMDEASLCDRIALIRDGEFMKIDTPKGIISGFRKELWAVRGSNMSALIGHLREVDGVVTCFAFGDNHHITVDNTVLTKEILRSRLEEKGHNEIYIEKIEAGIEDCFMELANR